MKKAALILALFIIPIVAIVIAIFFSSASSVPPPKAVALTVWGTRPETYFRGAFSTYTATRPYVTLKYTQVTQTDYRSQLIEAWALGTGPDIFLFPADELLSYQDFMAPAPATTTNYTYETTKQFGIKEETVITKNDVRGPSVSSLKQDFVDTAATDLVIEGKVYGLPLSIDTLVLYSNRDLLNQARIALPARTWDDFVKQVPLMTVINSEGVIIRSGASIGTAENVSHAEDILSLIIMQNGGSIVSTSTGVATLGSINKDATEQAILFYTDFAREIKSVYSWNDLQEQSLNAFAAGNVAYYIGLQSDDATIQERSTGLNYDISEMIQIDSQQPLNLAQYGAFGVSKTSKSVDTSWNFAQFLTSNIGAGKYVSASLETPARKDLIDVLLKTSTEQKYQVFAGQALSAVSWYKGAHKDGVKNILDSVITGSLESQDSVSNLISDAYNQLKVIAP